jgi:hypothetical protein
LGSGPLPPEVGQETRYRLIWQISNSYHELSDIKVSADLPGTIRFEGKKTLDAGTLSFDPEKRTVEWIINRLPLSVKNLEAQFEVLVVPSEEDRGRLLLLLSESQAAAQDTALQSQIVARAGALNSNLAGDKYAEGQGVVK